MSFQQRKMFTTAPDQVGVESGPVMGIITRHWLQGKMARRMGICDTDENRYCMWMCLQCVQDMAHIMREFPALGEEDSLDRGIPSLRRDRTIIDFVNAFNRGTYSLWLWGLL